MSDPIRILPHAETDLPIPPVSAILARCNDLVGDAERQHDTDTRRGLGRLINALESGMRMCWSLGDLRVSSASTPGVVYTVSCGACNCPARKPCKHLKLAEMLLDMLDTQAGDADFDPPIDIPQEPQPQPPGGPEPPIWPEPGGVTWQLGQRLAQARRYLLEAA
jgi:hypothetical protein